MNHPEGLAGVIASGPILAPLGLSPFRLALAKALSGILPRLTLNTGLDVTALSRDSAVGETYVNDSLVHSLGTLRLGTELTRAVEWTQAHAAEMRVPCLIVHGSADRLAPPEGSCIFCENMILGDKDRQVYEGYYHEVFNDVGKERVLAAVETWIGRHLRAMLIAANHVSVDEKMHAMTCVWPPWLAPGGSPREGPRRR